MECLVFYLSLLSALLPLHDAQTEQPPSGCAGPPRLCCPGQDGTCSRGCFCDEACVSFRDCCPDYASTCTNNSGADPDSTPARTVSPTTAPSSESSMTVPSNSTEASSSQMSAATKRSTASTPLDGLTASASTASRVSRVSRATAGVTQTETRTTAGADGRTPLPEGESTTEISTSSHEDSPVVTIHLRVSVLSTNNTTGEALLEALSNFIPGIIDCEGCTTTIRLIKPT